MQENLSSGLANNKGAGQPTHSRMLISEVVIRFLESIVSKNARSEIPNFMLVSVVLLCRKPRRQVFVDSKPIYLQISPTASSPVFDDRKRFPNFFRLESPDHKLNPAKIALMREFNWKKVATINHADVFFSLVIYDIARQEVIKRISCSTQLSLK